MRILFLSVFAASSIASSVSGQTATDHVALGDRDYAAMNAPSALAHYEKAIAADRENYKALWKASRSAIDIGSYLSDASRRSAMYANAERYARKSVALRPSDAEGHFSLARALGKTALSQSPRGRVKYGTEVRAQALECLKVAPEHAGCLHVMGMWNAEIMRLNGITRLVAKNILGGRVLGSASWKDAVRYMEQAVSAEPDRIVHHVDMGEVYRDVKQRTKARAEFETALKLPVGDVNDTHYKAQARAALTSF